ncbi:MAG: oxidoreductase [Acidobacteria bacterium SCN 69-37]|nr:MAG: oxidoreductase [Acidobacteria bacterium SCN 69-37]
MLPDIQTRRPLGRTTFVVGPLCIGTAPLGDMPDAYSVRVSEAQALVTLRAAFASPIDFFDTSNNYGDGRAERRIGIVLQEIGGLGAARVLATKADRDMTTGDFSGDRMKRSIEESLQRLGLDRLQFAYIHDPEHSTFENITSRGGALEAMQDLQRQGVIGGLGISGGPIDMLIRYVETGAFDAVETHNRFTLLNRSAQPLLDVCAARGVAVINAAPYGSGLLAKGPDAFARYAYQDAPAPLVDRARRLQTLCREHDVPLAAAALQFSMRDPRVTSTVIGMTRPERVTQTIELATTPIPDALWPALETVGHDMDDPEANRWTT